MRYLVPTLSLIAIGLAGCASMDPASNGAVKSLGGGQYSLSEMDILSGNVAEHAARFCSAQGKRLQVEGNTTQQGLASGSNYAVLIFSCSE